MELLTKHDQDAAKNSISAPKKPEFYSNYIKKRAPSSSLDPPE